MGAVAAVLVVAACGGASAVASPTSVHPTTGPEATDRSAPAATGTPVTTSTGDAAPGASPGARRRNVAAIGDSISFSATVELGAAFTGAGWSAQISAKNGDMFRDRLPFAAQIAASRPDAVVVNLGTNDVACSLTNATGGHCRYPTFDDAAITEDAERLRDLFEPGTCIVGVHPTWGQPAGEFWTREHTSGRVAGVIDWKAETDTHPNWVVDALGHLSADGRRAYATLLATETSRLCSGM